MTISAWFFRGVFIFLCVACIAIPFELQAKEAKIQNVFTPQPFAGIRVGEKLEYRIRWLGLEVGRARVEVKGIENIRGRDAYHIAVYVQSSSLIDLVYPVRDEHHTYVDTEHLHSLRYEKILKEGRYRADEVMEYDQEAHTAIYHSRRSGDRKQMLIPKDVQDQLSCGFWFRTQLLVPATTVHIPVNADEKNWDVEIRLLEYDTLKLGDLGTFHVIAAEPQIKFQGIFMRRGKIEGWMSIDKQRLPLKMTTKVPVLGKVNMTLIKYEGWSE